MRLSAITELARDNRTTYRLYCRSYYRVQYTDIVSDISDLRNTNNLARIKILSHKSQSIIELTDNRKRLSFLYMS